ncbi:MAG: efflux RND transporter periplasmic adaptor subunit [Candidatus Delongbacteria bacterium]
MKTRRAWLIPGMALALCLGGCGREAPHQVGLVEMAEIDVASKIPGRVDCVLVQEGQWVERGRLLAVIRSDEIEARVEQARGLLEAAEARLRMARSGARPEEIRAMASQLESARAQFELAEKTWSRVQAVYADSVISTQERDEVEFKYRAAREQLETGRAKLDLVRKGARDEEIEAARALAHQAANALAEAQAYQRETRLTAPRAGRVHSLVLDAGELAATGVPVVTLVDTTDVWVVLQLREDQLQGAAGGRRVTGSLPALGGRRAEFEVTRVAVLADFATWRSTSRKGDLDLRSFEVQLRPRTALAGLRAGMSVRLAW